MAESTSFPEALRRELTEYLRTAIQGTAWVASDVVPVALDEHVSGLEWRLSDRHGKSLTVTLDPRHFDNLGPVPNSSNLSDLAWAIGLLVQEHVLSYRSSRFRDGEVLLLEHKGRLDSPDE